MADQGGNIQSVTHERVNTAAEINGCTVRVEMDTRDQAHIDSIRRALIASGFKVTN